MRKVIGIGDTILDIIFRGEQPSAAVPGGSVFNGIVSLGRMGVNIGFISETGNEAQISIDSNSQPNYREKLNEELRQLRESEMWQTAVTVRKLRPENN